MSNTASEMSSTQSPVSAGEIAKQNDYLRRTFDTDGGRHQILVTAGVRESINPHLVLQSVSRFDDFNDSNDPHGEHDFGTVEVDGERYFFKIDSYTDDLGSGGDPVTNPKARRILTIMHESEY